MKEVIESEMMGELGEAIAGVFLLTLQVAKSGVDLRRLAPLGNKVSSSMQ